MSKKYTSSTPKGQKIVFVAVIAVFVLSMVSISAISFTAKPNPEIDKAILNKKNIETDVVKNEEGKSMGIEGTVRKLADGTYADAEYFLEASGVTLALLKSTKGINLESYLDKNVKVQGDTVPTESESGAIMDVAKIQLAE